MKSRLLKIVVACLTLAGVVGLSPSAIAVPLYVSALTSPPLTAGDLVGQDGWANHSGTGSLIQVGATGATLAKELQRTGIPLPLRTGIPLPFHAR